MEDKDESVLKELQSVKKDLEAARRANSKLEKDLIDINNAKQKVKISKGKVQFKKNNLEFSRFGLTYPHKWPQSGKK